MSKSLLSCGLLLAALLIPLLFAATSAQADRLSPTSQLASPGNACEQIDPRRLLPARVLRQVVNDCNKDPQRFGGGSAQGPSQLAAAGVVAKACSKCTAFCQTITFLNTYDWSADLGGGMTPSQCMDAVAAHCGGAYNSIMIQGSCQN